MARKVMSITKLLKRDGYSLERLVLYCLIHHDHHFLIHGITGKLKDSFDYDYIRRSVEPDFDDLFLWMHVELSLSEINPIRRLAKSLVPAHEWSMRLAKIWHDEFLEPEYVKRFIEMRVPRIVRE